MNTSGWDPNMIAMISLNWSFEALHVKLCSLPIGSSFWFVLASVSCLMLGNLVTRRNQNSWCLKMPWCWLRLGAFRKVHLEMRKEKTPMKSDSHKTEITQSPKDPSKYLPWKDPPKNSPNTCVINSEYQADTVELCGQVGMALIAKGHLTSRCRVSRVLNWVLHRWLDTYIPHDTTNAATSSLWNLEYILICIYIYYRVIYYYINTVLFSPYVWISAPKMQRTRTPCRAAHCGQSNSILKVHKVHITRF